MLQIADRIKETSLTTGTGSITLNGPYGGFQRFNAAIGDSNITYYTIENGVRWEVGQGTYDVGSNTLSRDIVFDSSAGGAKIDLEGVSTVFCTLPASKAFVRDQSDSVSLNNIYVSGEANINQISTNYIYNSGDSFLGGNTLVSGDLSVLGNFDFEIDGDIIADEITADFLTLVRPNSAGNFFHAYKDDGINQTVSLYVTSAVSPLWRLGLKSNPSSQTESPSFGYVYGRDGAVGLVSNVSNYLSLADSVGVSVVNDSHEIVNISSDDGVVIDQRSTVNPALVIEGAPLSISNLQEWANSAGAAFSVVDQDGKFGILNTNPTYDLDVNGSGRLQSVYLTNGIYFQDGTFQDSAFAGADPTAVSGWADVTMTIRDNAVSGWAASTFLTSDDDSIANFASGLAVQNELDIITVSGLIGDSEVANFASGLAVQNEIDIATVSGLLYNDSSLSGYFESRVDTNEAQIASVSGWADSTMSERDSAISGYLEDYVDSQDHSAASVSGWADFTMTDRDNSVSGYFQTTTTFDNDLTVSLGGGKTFGRYEDGDVIPASGLTAPDVITLAVTEPIDPTVNLSSSSSVDFNQTSVSVTLNFNHTINSLGASVASASLEFRRANTGSWTVLSTSTTTPDSFVHNFTDTAFNTDQLNYRYIVTDSVGATATATFNINPDTYSAPSISFNVDAPSLSGPESDLSRERGNDESDLINGNVSRNETYVDIQTAQWQYRADGGAWQDIDAAISLPAAGGSLSTKNHLPSETTASTIQYRIEVVDDYQTTYSSTITVNFGLLIFYGPSSSVPVTSANVRALPDRLFTNGNDTFNLNTGSSEVNFTVAIPDTETISEVLDLDALNANITAEYVNNPFNVDDGGGTAVAYNVYTMTIAIPYSSNHRHQVTKG